MNKFLGLIQFSMMVYIAISEYRRKSPIVFLWATLLLMFGLTHLFTVFISGYDYSSQVQIEASSFVIMFMLFYICVRFLTIQSYRNREILFLDHEDPSALNFFFFLILTGAIALRLYKYLQYAGNLFSTSWSLGRDYSATLEYFNSNQILGVLFYLSSGVLLYNLILKNKPYGLFCTILITIQVLITRNRIEVLPLFISFISIFLLKHSKLRVKEVLFLSLVGIIALYLIYALRAFRHYGSIETFINDFTFSSFHERVISLFRNEDGELGLRRDFYYFLKNDNKFTNFGKGHSYLRMLLVFIPTQWSFGFKPPDFAISMGAAIGMITGGSTHPTLFGDCFANLGWFGILLGAFWANFASFLDRIILKQKIYLNKVLLFNLYAVSFVIMGRGSVYNGFVPMAYGTVLLVIGCKAFLMISNKRNRRALYLK